MKEMVLAGDPQGIQNGLQRIFKDNPKMKIIAKCVGSWPGPKTTNIAMPPGQQAPAVLHVMYITYEGPDLVDADGKLLTL